MNESRTVPRAASAHVPLPKPRRKPGPGPFALLTAGGLICVISDIDALANMVSFSNGVVVAAGQAVGEVDEATIRRLQIREAIKAHLAKEQSVYRQGIKVLSLFFIDHVVKYRDYRREDTKGDYAQIFEEEYGAAVNEFLAELPFDHGGYREYLSNIDVDRTHKGYFSIDKKTRHLTDPTVKTRGEMAGQTDDVEAYDLILKEKERLLSFDEPVRFIFSHSALREGWDNPNVFVMGMLKHSDNTVSRRQEVGRGLRLAVNQTGERMDTASTVHSINTLTVVAGESYRTFVENLQKEIVDSLASRPRTADIDYFAGKNVQDTAGNTVKITDHMARQIYQYLVRNSYCDADDAITEAYHEARNAGTRAQLPPELQPYAEKVFGLIDSVFTASQMEIAEDDRRARTNPLTDNFYKKEFQELWKRINHKAVYKVDFDTAELVERCTTTLHTQLNVTPLTYTVRRGTQAEKIDYGGLSAGNGFVVTEDERYYEGTARSSVSYDLVGKVAAGTGLLRSTIVAILKGIEPAVFDKFRANPEQFIAGAIRLINEQKAATVIEKISYHSLEDRFDTDLFTINQVKQDYTRATKELRKHIYKRAIVESDTERKFVEDVDVANEVVVYAKLPKGFAIPTPVGDYNPDWAIAFEEGKVKHVYFVAETKGSMSDMQLRAIESARIQCATEYFKELNRRIDKQGVTYGKVSSYRELRMIVAPGT